MMEHYCEFDHNLENPPCGKPAKIRCHGMWMCADHYDWHTRFMAQFGLGPDHYPPDARSYYEDWL